jgi:peptide-methionine (R)-S-oxide reductase
MMMKRRMFLAALTVAPLAACAAKADPVEAAPRRFPVTKTDDEWKKQLTPQQYEVLRNKGTERAFTSPLLNEKRKGTFKCAGCGTPLFASETKFESGTGWPSFFQPLNDKVVLDVKDVSYGMVRVENVCATCGGHLGHVFDDGPKPTGLRYCMNGVSLTFEPAKT